MFSAACIYPLSVRYRRRAASASLRWRLPIAIGIFAFWLAGEDACAAEYSVSEQVGHRITLSLEGGGGCELPWTKGMKYEGDALPSIANSEAGAVGVGVGYRLAYKHLCFHTGFTAKYVHITNDPRDSTHSKDQILDPTNGLYYHLEERFLHRRDSIHSLRLQMPVMVGGEWGRFYFLAGVKLSAALYSPATRNWAYEGERDYQIFYETIITDQDQDLNRLPPLRYERPITLDVMGALEIGGRVNSRDDSSGFKRDANPRTDYYLSAYADYALWSSSPFNMLEIGVRLTVQWRVRKVESCRCVVFESL